MEALRSMHLPFEFTRTVEIDTGEDLSVNEWRQRFLREVANQLTKRKAQAVRIEGDRVEFLGPFVLFTSPYNLLTPITSGWIEAEASATVATVRYRLSFRRVFWPALATDGFILFIFRANSLPWTSALAWVVFGWFWIFVTNVVLRLWYFGRLMSMVFDSVVFDSVRTDSRNSCY
jgi:hypothetical protein